MKLSHALLSATLLIALCSPNITLANPNYDDYVLEWTRTYDDHLQDGANEYASGMAIDHSDNLVVVGPSYEGSIYHLAVLKLDTLGNMIWSYPFPLNCDSPRVVIDEFNNIVVGGIIIPCTGCYYDAFVAKLDSGGQMIWSRIYDYGGKYNNLGGIAVDSQNNIIIGGYFNDSGVNYDDDYYTIKLDQNGRACQELS